MTLKQFRNLSRGSIIINKKLGTAFIVTTERRYWGGSDDETTKPITKEDVITIVPYTDEYTHDVSAEQADEFYS